LQAGRDCSTEHQCCEEPFDPWISLLFQNAPPPILSAAKYDSPGKIIINEIMVTTIAIIIAVFVLIYLYISQQQMVDKIPKPVTIMVT